MMKPEIYDVRFYLPYPEWGNFSESDLFNAFICDLLTDYLAEFILQGGRTDDMDCLIYSGLEECPFDILPMDYFDSALTAIDELLNHPNNADVYGLFSSPGNFLLVDRISLVSFNEGLIHYQVTFRYEADF